MDSIGKVNDIEVQFFNQSCCTCDMGQKLTELSRMVRRTGGRVHRLMTWNYPTHRIRHVCSQVIELLSTLVSV